MTVSTMIENAGKSQLSIYILFLWIPEKIERKIEIFSPPTAVAVDVGVVIVLAVGWGLCWSFLAFAILFALLLYDG